MIAAGIYAISSPSGKRYIGSARHCAKRKREHWSKLRRGAHYNRSLQRAWAKYGESNFNFSVLLVCDEKDLFFYEQIVLDALKPEYNISPSACGSRGMRWTEESKAKLRGRKVDPALISAGVLAATTPEERSARARYARTQWTAESRRSQILKLTGLKQSDETVAKRSASLLGHRVTEETKLKLAAQAGWKHTDEAKAKMRGRARSLDHRAALSAAGLGQKRRLGRKGGGGKPVICVETGMIFRSMGLATDWLKSVGKTKARDCSSAISLACNGHRKIAFGSPWRFADSDLGLNGHDNAPQSC